MKNPFTVLLAIAFLAGCSASHKVGETEVVESSGAKESWVASSTTYSIEDGRMKFRVIVDNESDLSFGMQGLTGQAYRDLINAVKVRAGTEYDEAIKGSKYSTNSIGQARQSVVNAIGNVKFSDLVKEREYWEKHMKYEERDRVSYIYRIYGLYSISEEELARAKQEAWKNVSDEAERAADSEAKQLLDEAKQRFLDSGKK